MNARLDIRVWSKKKNNFKLNRCSLLFWQENINRRAFQVLWNLPAILQQLAILSLQKLTGITEREFHCVPG
jgi:hypothetical protein